MSVALEQGLLKFYFLLLWQIRKWITWKAELLDYIDATFLVDWSNISPFYNTGDKKKKKTFEALKRIIIMNYDSCKD